MDLLLLAQVTEAEDAAIGGLSHLATPMGRIGIALTLIVVGLLLILPPRGRGKQFWIGAICAAIAMTMLLWPSLIGLPAAPAFFLLEGLAVLGGIGTIASRSPVYCAIWFASALLAIGALLLMGGAQFLGLATVAVYAGAIVVTLLFVLMLAQPEGHSVYDRLGWGLFPTLSASLGGACLLGMVVCQVVGAMSHDAANAQQAESLRGSIVTAVAQWHADHEATAPSTNENETIVDDAATSGTAATAKASASQGRAVDAEHFVRSISLAEHDDGTSVLRVDVSPDHQLLSSGDAALATAIRTAVGEQLAATSRIEIREQSLLTEHHVASLGGKLFGTHLISIQVAGVLLLVALVGAIAMAVHGNRLPEAGQSSSNRRQELVR